MLLIKAFVAIALAVAALALSGANALHHCGTPEPTEEQLELTREMYMQEKAIKDSGVNTKVQDTITVDTVFHVVAASTALEDGYLTEKMLSDQLDVLNQDFAPHAISFKRINTTYTVNPDWAVRTNTDPNGQELTMKKALRQGSYSTLNVYFQKSLDANPSDGPGALSTGGFTWLPLTVAEGSDNFYRDGCCIAFKTVPGSTGDGTKHLGKTTTHEVGHWFGLWHTFSGGCSGEGDLIDDTPAQADIVFGCPIGQDSCPDQPGLDPIHNYMGYTNGSCTTEFTPDQEVRMRNQWKLYRG